MSTPQLPGQQITSNPFGPTTPQQNMRSGVQGQQPSTNIFGSAPSTSGQSASNPFGTSSQVSTFINPFSTNGANTENQFSSPGSSTLNLGNVPGITTQTYGLDPTTESWLKGQGGFTPQTLQSMKATATESAANAGQQAMAQEKRALAQNGIANSPASAGYQAAVAKQTGVQQQQNVAAVEQQNAQLAAQEQQQAAQLQTQVGEGNMNAANAAALANAQMLYNAMLANQQARLNTQFSIYGTP